MLAPREAAPREAAGPVVNLKSIFLSELHRSTTAALPHLLLGDKPLLVYPRRLNAGQRCQQHLQWGIREQRHGVRSLLPVLSSRRTQHSQPAHGRQFMPTGVTTGARGAAVGSTYRVQYNAAAAGGQVVVAQQLGQAVQLVPRTAAALSEQAAAGRGARPIKPVPQPGELGVQRRCKAPQPHKEPVALGADLVAWEDGQIELRRLPRRYRCGRKQLVSESECGARAREWRGPPRVWAAIALICPGMSASATPRVCSAAEIEVLPHCASVRVSMPGSLCTVYSTVAFSR